MNQEYSTPEEMREWGFACPNDNCQVGRGCGES